MEFVKKAAEDFRHDLELPITADVLELVDPRFKMDDAIFCALCGAKIEPRNMLIGDEASKTKQFVFFCDSCHDSDQDLVKYRNSLVELRSLEERIRSQKATLVAKAVPAYKKAREQYAIARNDYFAKVDAGFRAMQPSDAVEAYFDVRKAEDYAGA
jgi:hypothetical protein